MVDPNAPTETQVAIGSITLDQRLGAIEKEIKDGNALLRDFIEKKHDPLAERVTRNEERVGFNTKMVWTGVTLATGALCWLASMFFGRL